MKRNNIFFIAFLVLAFTPLAHADVESSLVGVKNVLLGSILPVFAVLGLGFAAFSFFTGNPNAKQHLVYSVTGAAILFGAQSIADLIQRVIR
jgi:type IV secretory pathway VirB2 component (pilin)